jgi:hypothetical protein
MLLESDCVIAVLNYIGRRTMVRLEPRADFSGLIDTVFAQSQNLSCGSPPHGKS